MSEHVEHNGSGCIDVTVDVVIKREHDRRYKAREDCKYRNMSRKIKKILECNGYVLEGPISLIKVESGRKRRIY